MERIVRVARLLPDGTAEVSGERGSACGGNCAQCGGCGPDRKTIRVTANNPLGAHPGDWVVLRSSTGEMLALAWAVYFLPVVLLLVGAIVWDLPGGLAGLALGVGGVVALDRVRAKRSRICHTICAYAPDYSEQSTKQTGGESL